MSAEQPTTRHPSLAAALAAFQADLPKVGKGNIAQVKSEKGNYSYKYADLSDVSAAVLPRLAAHGLSFSCKPTLTDDGRFVLAYRLRHDSGEDDAGLYPLPTSGTPQQVGSAMTYARRYVLSAVTGVAPDEDDDGQAASQREHSYERPPTSRRRQEQAGDTEVDTAAADAAREALRAKCDEHGYDLGRVAAAFADRYDGALLKFELSDGRIRAFTTLLDSYPEHELRPAVEANGAAR